MAASAATAVVAITAEQQPMSGSGGKHQLQQGAKKGWLFKWTNYLKGYQRRWFVLADGMLSYYRYDTRRDSAAVMVGVDEI